MYNQAWKLGLMTKTALLAMIESGFGVGGLNRAAGRVPELRLDLHVPVTGPIGTSKLFVL